MMNDTRYHSLPQFDLIFFFINSSIFSQHLHGRFVKHPFISNRRIPIIADSVTVDMEFGTGAVKITPAHDPNDYDVGVRHGLEFINILNDDGTLNGNAGERFKGMKRFHARVKVVSLLKELGLFEEVKDNPMQIPICRWVMSLLFFGMCVV
jgi:valyl-tRNA synthetase